MTEHDPSTKETCKIGTMIVGKDDRGTLFDAILTSSAGREIFSRLSESEVKKIESRLESEGWHRIKYESHQDGWDSTFER